MLDLNVDMKNNVKIALNFLDHRKLKDQMDTAMAYAHIREVGEIILDERIGKFNRVVILKVDDTYWYLSAAADKNGHPYEELFFFESTAEDVEEAKKYVARVKEERGE